MSIFLKFAGCFDDGGKDGEEGFVALFVNN